MHSIRTDLLPYAERLERRDPATIERIVIHATELPDLATAREYGERIHYDTTRTGNSGHFYIDRDGTVERWVPIERIAHHVAGHNATTIGIELVHNGRYPDWLDSRHQAWELAYPDAQIDALSALIRALRAELPGLTDLAGHDQLDRRMVPASNDDAETVRRKLDPGPTFPWQRVVDGGGLPRLSAPPATADEAGGP
ncbi:N-acetylmuramoyl-L-alanine amidase [Wenzhouxiangella sp. XN79A]|uniref:N-acetylmuramoyl-L-alanine amidase n=1 Tax=Wenzhouxiangella sp. XN79A TaxID=2724193 RepID=UPI00197EB1B0|nr:N-acetylmuramoyl-L-alanine amidase [Wenzhouxiangella sp. XN79A]